VADRTGQQLGNYRLVKMLGQGGYAEVYLGQHVQFKQQAAVKVLHAHLRGQEIEHFQQEAETIATLAHPGIIRVLDLDVQDGLPFLVIDYAPNGSLRQRYPKGSLVPLPVILSSVKQVADALQYVHEQKFIHRDVKPENMLLGRRQEVLLSDFGIATIAHSTSSVDVRTEGASGTLAYMAPEQIEGHPRVASDQYALAAVVYEWLCGECPFEGSLSEVMAQHLSVPPLPLRERVPTISPEVEQVVLRALSKDPKTRFASVADLSAALEQASHYVHSSTAIQSDEQPRVGSGDAPGYEPVLVESGQSRLPIASTTSADLPVGALEPTIYSEATIMRSKTGVNLGYHTHYVVDGGRARIIVAALVTPSEVMDNQPMLDLLWRTRFRWKLRTRQVTGDKKYGSEDNLVAIEHRGIQDYIPIPDVDHRTEFFSVEAFSYDSERDVYICPAGKELHFAPWHSTERSLRYRAHAKDCNHCPLKPKCTAGKQGRSLCCSVDETCLERVRAYQSTEPYKKALRKW
jgi:serine/threonine protein kinase